MKVLLKVGTRVYQPDRIRGNSFEFGIDETSGSRPEWAIFDARGSLIGQGVSDGYEAIVGTTIVVTVSGV